MRTREIKINGEKKKCILVAGGQGFKIYTSVGIDGWILDLGKIVIVEDSSQDAKTVSKYVSIKYQQESAQKEVKESFINLINSLKS